MILNLSELSDELDELVGSGIALLGATTLLHACLLDESGCGPGDVGGPRVETVVELAHTGGLRSVGHRPMSDLRMKLR